jgi:hypothetical protein
MSLLGGETTLLAALLVFCYLYTACGGVDFWLYQWMVLRLMLLAGWGWYTGLSIILDHFAAFLLATLTVCD